MSTPTAEQLTGRTIGALFFAVFGSAWLALWLAATQRLGTTTGALLGVGLLALALTGGWVLRRTKQLPTAASRPTDAAKKRREWRVFGVVNIGQWGGIFFAGWLLPRLGLAVYFTPVMVVIVGLHLFPLARLFQHKRHYLTGGALLAWALGCLLITPQNEWQASVSFGAGSILWLSAGYTLWHTAQVLRTYTDQYA